MGPRAAIAAALLILLLLAIPPTGMKEVLGASATPVVARVFYLSTGPTPTPRILTSDPPTGESLGKENFTGASIDFVLPGGLLSSATIRGQVTFSLLLSSNETGVKVPSIHGVFGERGVFNTTLSPTSSGPYIVGTSPTRHNVTFDIPERPLAFAGQIFVGINATIPSGQVTVTLHWGTNYRSLVILPLSAYATVRKVDILDQSQRATASFNLNATIGSNVVVIQASIASAFGLKDITEGFGRVNLTIVVDPDLRPVRGASNLEMEQFPPSQDSPATFTATWAYPSNSTEGVYRVYIDVFDSQNNRAFSFRGPASFGLFRPRIFLPPPFDLIPYFAVAGVGAVGGILYYKKRKTKSYLVPFDHFNTLTGGELEGGTVVTVEGNTGSGKTLLSEQLMYEDLKRGRPCVFVATGDFPSNIRTNMKAMGLDVTGYEQGGLLTFVDGYSAEAGQESKEKFSIPSLGDLTTLGIKITSSLPSGSLKGASLYFDSLTPLASKVKPESIVSFIQSVGARVRGMAGKAFFTVGPSVDGMVQRQLQEMADCVVQMEAFEEGGVRKRRLRIAKFRARHHQEGWAIFTIEDGKGIIFYSKRARK